MAGLDGPRLPPRSGGPARQLVALLHGVGADGADLIGLAPVLAQAFPDAAFVAPDAPFPCEILWWRCLEILCRPVGLAQAEDVHIQTGSLPVGEPSAVLGNVGDLVEVPDRGAPQGPVGDPP